MPRENWSREELDVIVEDYFDMLRSEIRGLHYSKTEHRNRLMSKISRSKGSIEFKHCNITAVLEELGISGINGYKPRDNYQAAIINAIDRYLTLTSGRDLLLAPESPKEIKWVESPTPMFRNVPRNVHLESVIRKFDPVERDRRNRDLGLKGEKAVLAFEQKRLFDNGRVDLAERVRHVSVEIGDGLGYDIESFQPDGRPKHIEVKTTSGGAYTPFFMSRNERDCAERLADTYYLYRVHRFNHDPLFFTLRPPLDQSVRFSTEVWRAEMS